MSIKKLGSAILAVVLVLTLLPVPKAQAAYFKDVSPSHWAYKDINFMSDNRVINGFADGYFKPSIVITRKDAAVMMVRALQLDELGPKTVDMADMKSFSPGYREVKLALSYGWFSTFNGEFRPSETLTRDEMAKALAVAFDFTGNGTSTFTDVPADDSYYDYIDAILYRNVTTGYSDNTYRPLTSVTRAQFTAFMSRVFQQPLAYEIKSGGETAATAPSLEEAITIAAQIDDSTIHPMSNRFRQYPQTIGSADKTGIKAGVLIYNGVGEIDSFTPEFFDPYLSYQTKSGKQQAMFDTFIILALRYDGGYFSGSETNKSDYADWQTHIDRTFGENGALRSLNEAAEQAGRTADVYVSIPYPNRTESFTRPDGREVANDYFARFGISKWYIESVLNKMQSPEFENLNFKGFYWTSETVGAAEDEILVSSLARLIHKHDKYFIYSPHALSTNFKSWQSYDFDAAFLQPNAFRASVAGKEARLHRAFVNAQIHGSGITLEIDSYGTAQAELGIEAFDLYMDMAERYGLDEGHMIMYQGTNVVARMASYDHPVFKRWHEQLTGTFFPESP